MIWGVIAALALVAQDPVTGSAAPDLIEGLTSQAIEIARAGAGHARLSDGSPLPAATAEDRRLFAVPPALETQTVRRGFLTGQLEYCRADGVARSFLPYMGRLRASGRYSERQLAYIGVLHGVSQQMIVEAMEFSRAEVCSDAAFVARLGAAAETLARDTP